MRHSGYTHHVAPPMPPAKTLPMAEFIALLASMISLAALSIDAILPALPAIGTELSVAEVNHRQWVVSYLLIGMGFGLLILPPLSDSFGRRPLILVGFAIFLFGSLLALFAQSFAALLAGRLLQGFGAAAPRAVSTALVRDGYHGVEMARIMSFMMAVFVLVPAVAPLIGQVLQHLYGWRAIFWLFFWLALVIAAWFFWRQPETLSASKRVPTSIATLVNNGLTVLKTPLSLNYTVIIGLTFGGFLGYLNSSQQIFQDIYQQGARFPLYFAAIALGIGAMSLINARLLKRWRIEQLCRATLIFIAGLSVLFLLLASRYHGQPPFGLAMVYFFLCLSPFGLLFGNLHAIAMEPLGNIAGVGAAVIGAVSTLIAVPLGMGIGLAFNHTLYPLTAGLLVLPFISLTLILLTDHRELRD